MSEAPAPARSSPVLRLLAAVRAALSPLLGPERSRRAAAYLYAVGLLLVYSFQEQHRRAVLGLLWMLVTPVLFLAVYLPLFSGFGVGAASEALVGGRYGFSIFVTVGIVAWTAFVEGVQGGAASLVSRPGLIQHSPVPLSVLPLVKVLSGLVALTISSALLLAVLGAIGRWPGERLLLLPPTLLLFGAFTFGLALLVSATAVVFRDLLQVLGTLLLVEFFAAPIVYLPHAVSERFQFLLELNPLTPFLNLLRAAFIAPYPFAWGDLVLASAWAAVTLAVGALAFRRLSSSIPDYV